MKKRSLITLIVAGLVVVSLVGASGSQTTTPTPNAAQTTGSKPAVPAPEPKTPTCDGKIVTEDCIVDETLYETYIYHEATPEKSHTETVTTYREEVSGYCTLCNDGTYSPSCATGRGACSHHGGVAQWNAPRYSRVPETSSKKVVDTPAEEVYYEKKPASTNL